MVVEASFPSISVGYEVSLAIHHNKPTLILYTHGTSKPTFLIDHVAEKVVCESYTLSSVHHLLDDFLNFARSQRESRYTFFITPEIATYLEEIAHQEKLPKSVYLRKLIEKDMLVKRSR